MAAAFKGKVRLLDLDPPNGYRIEGEGEALQEAVAEGYREVARLFPDRIALIPAAGTLDEVHTRVLAAVIGGT